MSYQCVPLGEITTLQAGIGFPPNLQGRTEGLYPFAKVGDISRGGRTGNSILAAADHYVDQLDVEVLRAKLVPIGSVLFAKIGEAIRQNHRVIAGCPMLIDNNAMAAIPSAKVNGRFLYHYLKTVDFYCLAPATTVPALRKSDLERLPIPLPPLPEQRRIAAILDQADTLRAKRREALAQLDSLTQSIFIEMFGDPVTNLRGWPSSILQEAVAGKYGVKAGPFGSSLKKEDYSSSGYRVYGQEQVIAGSFDIGDYFVGDRKFEQLKSCAVAEGDLLVSLVGSFGKVLIVPSGVQPGIINPRLLKITPDTKKLTSPFLAQLLGSHAVQTKLTSLSHGGTMGILNAGLLKGLTVILPPVALQQAFATRIQAVDSLKANNRSALAELDALFSSLQHRAFRGEL